ncbi:MAG: YceI family protein [Saprospiraceae bacterium]|nr:YceI family protein [Saprospiraceae bacterium]
MKNASFTTIAAGLAFSILSIALAQCSSGPEGNASDPQTSEAAAPPPVTAMDSTAVPATPTTAPEPVQPAPATQALPLPTTTKPKPTPTKEVRQSNQAAQKAKPEETTSTKPMTAPKPEPEVPVITKQETVPPPSAPKADKATAPSAPVTTSAGVSYKSVKGVIHGTSTLHDWDSQIGKISGKGTLQLKDKLPTALKDMEIKIEVKGIKSKEGKKMDDKTFETFKSDKHPYILFSFGNAPIKIGDGNAVTIEATGDLSMAGTTKSVTLTATGKLLPNGDLQLSASKKIKMTDYNMEPPVMMLGTIKVGNEVTVSFDFVLVKD